MGCLPVAASSGVPQRQRPGAPPPGSGCSAAAALMALFWIAAGASAQSGPTMTAEYGGLAKDADQSKTKFAATGSSSLIGTPPDHCHSARALGPAAPSAAATWSSRGAASTRQASL